MLEKINDFIEENFNVCLMGILAVMSAGSVIYTKKYYDKQNEIFREEFRRALDKAL